MTAPGIFITGTDTGVGKTYIGAQLCRLLRNHGVPVQPRKPVESGCKPDKYGQLIPEDAVQYFSACQQTVSLQQICPYTFAAVVAPDHAASLAGKNLPLEKLVAACQVTSEQFLLVEGAGGFYSPIATDGLNADLAARLDLPVLLVAANRLGTINQVLLTVEAIHRNGLKLAAVILNNGTTLNVGENLNNTAGLVSRLDCPVLNSAKDSVLEESTLDFLGL